MKVIRIYDDKKTFYNNIKWVSLCSADVLVEYCTFQNRNRLRIVVDESYNNTTEENWNLNPDNEYLVFLDTRWDSGLVDQLESGKVAIAKGLISQLKQPCVSRVMVYTLYGPDEGKRLVEALRENDDLVNKVKNKLFEFSTYQPDEVIRVIGQEVE